MSEDDELAQIIAKSEHPHAAAERVFQLFGKRFIVEKNTDETTAGAYDEPGDHEGDENDEDEAEAETQAERRARLRRELAEADGRERRRNAVPTRKAALTMDDLTTVADTLCKRADAKTISKLAAAEVERGGSIFTNYERSVMLTAVAKAQDRGGGSDDRAFSKFLQDPGNLLFRQWALLPANVAELRKRDSLLDDAVAKTRAAGDGAGGARALGGDRVYPRVTGAVLPVNRPTEADKEREAAIDQQMRLGRWQTVEEAARYVDGLQAELERMARAKQERARPGRPSTLERV
jgi:hypothetical protein